MTTTEPSTLDVLERLSAENAAMKAALYKIAGRPNKLATSLDPLRLCEEALAKTQATEFSRRRQQRRAQLSLRDLKVARGEVIPSHLVHQLFTKALSHG